MIDIDVKCLNVNVLNVLMGHVKFLMTYNKIWSSTINVCARAISTRKLI